MRLTLEAVAVLGILLAIATATVYCFFGYTFDFQNSSGVRIDRVQLSDNGNDSKIWNVGSLNPGASRTKRIIFSKRANSVSFAVQFGTITRSGDAADYISELDSGRSEITLLPGARYRLKIGSDERVGMLQ